MLLLLIVSVRVVVITINAAACPKVAATIADTVNVHTTLSTTSSTMTNSRWKWRVDIPSIPQILPNNPTQATQALNPKVRQTLVLNAPRPSNRLRRQQQARSFGAMTSPVSGRQGGRSIDRHVGPLSAPSPTHPTPPGTTQAQWKLLSPQVPQQCKFGRQLLHTTSGRALQPKKKKKIEIGTHSTQTSHVVTYHSTI
jgi:hypothetical protein